MATPRSFVACVVLGSAVLLASATDTLAQTPAAYEATPHGRALACFGSAYSLVELIDVATQNLSMLAFEVRRAPDLARPAVAAGLARAGAEIDQRQSLDVAERLATCTEGLGRRATPDAAAAFAAAAVREEIDVAISMTDGFISDYQMLSTRLSEFFSSSADAAAQASAVRPFTRFGEQLHAALQRSKVAIDEAIARSTPKPDSPTAR